MMRIERPAVVADGAAGTEAATQPVHDILADDRPPRLQHAGDDGGVEVGDEALEGERAEAHWHPGDCDVILEADGLAREDPCGRSLDPAPPRPGIERVFIERGPVAGRPGGRGHWRPGFLESGLHEGVELSELVEEVLPVETNLLRTQVD